MDYKKNVGLGYHARRMGTRLPSLGPKKTGNFFRLTHTPQRVRLIDGQYDQEVYDSEEGKMVREVLPYFLFFRHWDPNSKNYINCSAINEADPRPCIGCAMGLKKTQANAFTIIQLETFHKVPWYKEGKPIIRNGKPVMIDKLCEGRNCPMCAAQAESFFGKKLHWSVNIVHLEYLVKEEDRLKSRCECGKELMVTTYSCPTCGEVLIDYETTRMTDSAILQAYNSGMFCDRCKRVVRLVDNLKCECGNARPLGLFSVDMLVNRVDVPGSTNYNLGVQFSPPCPIDPKYKGDTRPLELPTIYAPTPIRLQRTLLKVEHELADAVESEAEGYPDASSE